MSGRLTFLDAEELDLGSELPDCYDKSMLLYNSKADAALERLSGTSSFAEDLS